MNGVEILSQAEVVSSTGFNWITFWICVGTAFLLGVIGFLIYSYMYGSLDFEDIALSLMVGLLCSGLGVLLGLGLGLATGKPTDYETQYKVTISDEVSMNEFLEKYEIIDQEGKIYTVIENEQLWIGQR